MYLLAIGWRVPIPCTISIIQNLLGAWRLSPVWLATSSLLKVVGKFMFSIRRLLSCQVSILVIWRPFQGLGSPWSVLFQENDRILNRMYLHWQLVSDLKLYFISFCAQMERCQAKEQLRVVNSLINWLRRRVISCLHCWRTWGVQRGKGETRLLQVNGRYSPYLLFPGLVFQYASKELQFYIWGYSLRALWGSGVIGFKLLVFSVGTELLLFICSCSANTRTSFEI